MSRNFLYHDETWDTLAYPGAYATYLDAISGSTVLGHYLDAGQEPHDFIYDGHTWTTLNYPGMINYPAGSVELGAKGISGTSIVGTFGDASGGTHGFLLTIPETASLALLTAGGLLIARRRRA